jgi:hypothetical protein
MWRRLARWFVCVSLMAKVNVAVVVTVAVVGTDRPTLRCTGTGSQ